MIRPKDLTIVVTAYNIAEYIKPCLMSIISNGGNLSEVLVIDDGSRDDTADIALSVSREYPNIRYHYRENGGASAARNTALDMVNTPFLTYVDGDDLIADDGISKLIKRMQMGDDILISSRRLQRDADGTVKDQVKFDNIVSAPITELERDMLRLKAMHGKVFSVHFLRENNLRFEEGIIWEDLIFSYNAYLFANIISTTSDYTYIWRKRVGENKSVMQSPLTEHSIQSRLRQIQATIAISSSVAWKTKFKHGASVQKEFGQRLMKHLDSVRVSPDELLAKRAFEQIRGGIRPHEDWIMSRGTPDVQRLYGLVIAGKFDELRALPLPARLKKYADRTLI